MFHALSLLLCACTTTFEDSTGKAQEEASGDRTRWYPDQDGDGFGAEDTWVELKGLPSAGDWVKLSGDCDDGDPTIHPRGEEGDCPDGLDQDCDGWVDDGALDSDGDGVPDCQDPPLYLDQDGDGYGRDDAPAAGTVYYGEWVLEGGDCDDSNDQVHPGAEEGECPDGVDQDCDGSVDEGAPDSDGDGVADCLDPARWYRDEDGDGYGRDDLLWEGELLDPEGWSQLGGDCADAEATIHPGAAPEDCGDLVDRNCDGGSEENTDGDGDGWVACLDCDDADSEVYPGAAERCDGLDSDCDTLPDAVELVEPFGFLDFDGDGFGDPSQLAVNCELTLFTVADGTDCDDGNDSIHPGAEEICDALDNDCDGEGACDPGGSPFGGGSGTEADPYRICSPAQLEAVETAPEAWFRQESDLSFGGRELEPLFELEEVELPGGGTSGTRVWSSWGDGFAGDYDGNSCTISDLTWVDSEEGAMGLFRYVEDGAWIHDLNLTGLDLQGGELVGGLAVWLEGEVESVTVEGRLSGAATVGGLAAECWGCSISRSSFTGTIFSSAEGDRVGTDHDTGIGGIVGNARGASMTDVAVNAQMEWSSAGTSIYNWTHAGGLAGYAGSLTRSSSSMLTTTVESSAIDGAQVDVQINGVYSVGGAVGTCEGGGSVQDVEVRGYVTGTVRVGGLFGYGACEAYQSSVQAFLLGEEAVGGVAGVLASPSVAGTRYSELWVGGDVVGVRGLAGGLVGYLNITSAVAFVDSAFLGVVSGGDGSTSWLRGWSDTPMPSVGGLVGSWRSGSMACAWSSAYSVSSSSGLEGGLVGSQSGGAPFDGAALGLRWWVESPAGSGPSVVSTLGSGDPATVAWLAEMEPLTSAEMSMETSYPGCDFGSTWVWPTRNDWVESPDPNPPALAWLCGSPEVDCP